MNGPIVHRPSNLAETFSHLRNGDEASEVVTPVAASGSTATASQATPASTALDVVQMALSIAGMFDPTPVCDGLDAAISLLRGDYLGAGVSAVAMLPYLGDAAKLGKLAKFAATLEEVTDLARVDPAFIKNIAASLDTIRAALAGVPPRALPKPAAAAIESMQASLRAIERGSEAATPARRIAAASGASAVLPPGPPSDFPLRGGDGRFWRPERPDTLFRIMGYEEGANTLSARQLQAGRSGAMGSKFLTLDSQYAMLFREKGLADAMHIGDQAVDAVAKLRRDLDKITATLRRPEIQADSNRLRALGEASDRIRLRIAQMETDVPASTQRLVDDWFAQPGQKVAVEINLRPGSVQQMLDRAVHEPLIGKYHGDDVYIWKLERGYGRNLAVPAWQLDKFNAEFVENIVVHALRAPFGTAGVPKDWQ